MPMAEEIENEPGQKTKESHHDIAVLLTGELRGDEPSKRSAAARLASWIYKGMTGQAQTGKILYALPHSRRP